MGPGLDPNLSAPECLGPTRVRVWMLRRRWRQRDNSRVLIYADRGSVSGTPWRVSPQCRAPPPNTPQLVVSLLSPSPSRFHPLLPVLWNHAGLTQRRTLFQLILKNLHVCKKLSNSHSTLMAFLNFFLQVSYSKNVSLGKSMSEVLSLHKIEWSILFERDYMSREFQPNFFKLDGVIALIHDSWFNHNRINACELNILFNYIIYRFIFYKMLYVV